MTKWWTWVICVSVLNFDGSASSVELVKYVGCWGQDHVDHQTSFKQYMNELTRMETRANVSRLQHVCYKYVGDRYWLFENQGYYTGWFIEGYIGTKYKIKITRFYRMWVWKFEYISTPSNWIASEPGFNYGFQCLIKQD